MIFKQFKDGSCDIEFSWKERILLLRKGKLHFTDESFKNFTNMFVKMAMDFPDEIDAIVILAGSIDPALEPYEWHRKPMSSKFIRWMIPKAFTASNDEILTTKAELTKMLPDWEKIKIPIIVIQGTKDGFVPKENADFAKRMAKKAQVKLRMLPGQSHFFPFTKPEIVMEELMLLR